MLISSRLLSNVERMIGDVPQPTMFGGKRQRDFVLPASTDYDYPASLAVGHLSTTGMPRTLGGSFWEDFGETEFLDEDKDKYHLEGGKFSFGKAFKTVAPIAKSLGMALAKEGIKQGVKYGTTSKGGRRKAPERFSDVIVPEGKEALRDYIAKMGIGHPVAYGNGKSKNAGMVRALVAGKPTVAPYKPFALSKVNNPSKDLISRYGKKPRGRKPKAAVELVEEFDIEPVKKPRGRKPKAAVEDEMEGGVLLRDVPSQFHSSVYPPALASYTAGHDAYGRGRIKGGARSNARGAIVKEVMKKHGLSLPEASKFVKQHNLY